MGMQAPVSRSVRAVAAGLAVLLLLGGVLARSAEDPLVDSLGGKTTGQRPVYNEADRQAVRQQVREGKINRCVTDKVARSQDKQFVVFRNLCDVQINVMLCVREKGGEPNYFEIIMTQRSETRQELLVAPKAQYHYTYNVCDQPYCTAPQSEC